MDKTKKMFVLMNERNEIQESIIELDREINDYLVIISNKAKETNVLIKKLNGKVEEIKKMYNSIPLKKRHIWTI